jgi:hypothetical protein
MALANRKNKKRFFKDRSNYGLINDDFKTEASRSLANEDFANDPASIGVLKPALYRMDLIDEDIDELRRHITNDRTQTDNNFTDANQTKLNGIETSADVTDATNVKSALNGMSLTDVGTPASTDRILLQDASNSNNLKYATFDEFGGSGGGLTETPLAMMSGRWQWASTDEGERIHVGSTAYGPFNYYVFSTEPVAIKGSTNLLRYNSSHVVNTTTAPIYPYYSAMMGVWAPNNGKKIKMKASGRFQGANSGATFGISLWDAPDPSNGAATNVSHTATLRGESNSITVDTTSTKYWSMELTTTNAINSRWALPMIENRTGNWTSNVYFYGQIALYLVD